MSPEAEMVWHESEKYMNLAEKYLGITGPRIKEQGSIPLHTEIARVGFLFPNVSPEARQKIAECRCIQVFRKGYEVMAENLPSSVSAAIDRERWEANHEDIVEELRRNLVAFTGLQVEILEEKYLKTLDEQLPSA